MHHRNPIPCDAQIASPRIDDQQTVAFLLADVRHMQLIGIEKFDDVAFKKHVISGLIMSDELRSPLIGSSLRIEDKEQLEEFLSRPDAADVVKSASFEEV